MTDEEYEKYISSLASRAKLVRERNDLQAKYDELARSNAVNQRSATFWHEQRNETRDRLERIIEDRESELDAMAEDLRGWLRRAVTAENQLAR